MSYLDSCDADLIALTRIRRAEAVAWRLEHRLSGHARLAVIYAWKTQQWALGNRRCFYCSCYMIFEKDLDRQCTVDHVRPRTAGGADHPKNFVLCCRLCNETKADFSEATFRRFLLPVILQRRDWERTLAAA